ncbi:MAG: acetate/propionate family kinase [Phycisphaerae bacterium]
MKVFVVNCGSSSIKYQLFSMTHETVLAKGVMERVGTEDANLAHTANGDKYEKDVSAPDHGAGLKLILAALTDPDMGGVLKSIDEIQGVGHRVVHGGEDLTGATLIDDTALAIIEKNAELAPLHNPPNLAGIRGAQAAMPDVPQVAVFDTAFLSTLPPHAHRYAVPEEWYLRHHVRKYGFHGTSHKYVTLHTAELMGKDPDDMNLVTCHLGNGCSMTAVVGGRAVDHSMGMTPLEGLMMGTRTGDVDPAIVLYMLGRGLGREEIDKAMNKESGLLGVSGMSNDMRDLLSAEEEGNAKAALAVRMFSYRLAKYIGSYIAILPKVDAVVFTGGIGENSHPVRARTIKRLENLGVKLDEQRNADTIRGKQGPITTDDSTIAFWIVPTNEELMIARETRQIVEQMASAT